ncbi:Mitochondrial import inner membrane translocase subunit Tim13 [Strongyloides ratti]|uniref:Mitochondrial import inner membrane translocase subunit n=1 Tax=Strongyloides ratti TaxID=34506 RepID=A0A090MX11_STRRB|nr:Mitochondrial import inner membrane translocase subunit Tim13 [Strongyloides ratti]CEF64624.1 Mitochondrial import inner membrane translocase subunit Tim13 [Strongyloides ratti]
MESMLDLEELKKLSPDQQKQVLASVQQQAVLQQASTLITDLSEKCTTACIKSPGESLVKSEQQCLTRCMDRYMESWNYVSQVLQSRIMPKNSSSYGDLSGGSTFS